MGNLHRYLPVQDAVPGIFMPHERKDSVERLYLCHTDSKYDGRIEDERTASRSQASDKQRTNKR